MIDESFLISICFNYNIANEIIDRLQDKTTRDRAVNKQNHLKRTPLINACDNRNFDFVKLLLENNADVKLKDQLGENCLDYAYKKKDKQIIELLKQYGAERNYPYVKFRIPIIIYLLMIIGIV